MLKLVFWIASIWFKMHLSLVQVDITVTKRCKLYSSYVQYDAFTSYLIFNLTLSISEIHIKPYGTYNIKIHNL